MYEVLLSLVRSVWGASINGLAAWGLHNLTKKKNRPCEMLKQCDLERLMNVMCYLLWYQALDWIFCCFLGSEVLVDVKKLSRKAMLVKCSTFDCTFCVTTDSFKNYQLHICRSNVFGTIETPVWDHWDSRRQPIVTSICLACTPPQSARRGPPRRRGQARADGRRTEALLYSTACIKAWHAFTPAASSHAFTQAASKDLSLDRFPKR